MDSGSATPGVKLAGGPGVGRAFWRRSGGGRDGSGSRVAGCLTCMPNTGRTTRCASERRAVEQCLGLAANAECRPRNEDLAPPGPGLCIALSPPPPPYSPHARACRRPNLTTGPTVSTRHARLRCVLRGPRRSDGSIASLYCTPRHRDYAHRRRPLCTALRLGSQASHRRDAAYLSLAHAREGALPVRPPSPWCVDASVTAAPHARSQQRASLPSARSSSRAPCS